MLDTLIFTLQGAGLAVAICLLAIVLYLFFVVPAAAIMANAHLIQETATEMLAYYLRRTRDWYVLLRQWHFRQQMRHYKKHAEWLDAVGIVQNREIAKMQEPSTRSTR